MRSPGLSFLSLSLSAAGILKDEASAMLGPRVAQTQLDPGHVVTVLIYFFLVNTITVPILVCTSVFFYLQPILFNVFYIVHFQSGIISYDNNSKNKNKIASIYQTLRVSAGQLYTQFQGKCWDLPHLTDQN
jgi:hypothetical protein